MSKMTRPLLAMICFLGSVVHASVLVQYDISSSAEHPNRHAPSTLDSRVSATDLMDVGTAFNYSSAFSTNSLVVLADTATDDFAEALSAGTYMAFTISADGGSFLSLDTVDFGAYPGAGTPRAFAVYSSVEGFAEGHELLQVSYSATATEVDAYSIDLSTRSGYDHLGSVEFRIYIQSASTSRSVNLSDITVTGNVDRGGGFGFYILGVPRGVVASADWLVLSNFTTDVIASSVFDFSFCTDAPAGKYGSLIVTPKGHFEFIDRPGVRARFRGVNLVSYACFLDHVTADLVADRLVRSGFNSVRLHHFDRDLHVVGATSSQLNAVKLEQLDYLFYALKSRGLYVNIDLFSLREFSAEEMGSFGLSTDVAAGLSDVDTRTLFKGLLPFSDAAFEAWADYSDALLTHVNPYTELTWMNDPALVGICPVNEDVVNPTVEIDPRLAELYEVEFSTWLGLDDHQSIYDRDGYDGTFGRFLIEAHSDLDQRIMTHLKNLGVSTLLTGSNHRDFQGLTYLREAYDYVDDHQYWDHPRFPGERFQLPFQFKQQSAVASAVSTPRYMMPSRYFEKPFVVTEFNYVRPNRYRSEGGVVISAYAGLQDWDGLYNFDYANGFVDDAGKLSDNFSISADPIGLLGDRVSSLIFLDEQITPASDTIVFSAEDLTAFTERGAYFGDVFTRLGLTTRIASTILPPEEMCLHAGVSAVVVDKDSSSIDLANGIYSADSTTLVDQLKNGGIIATNAVDTSEVRYRSETGQVALDTTAGTLQVAAPRCELFVLPPFVALDGSLVSVTNQDVFCSVFVVAVDQQPLTDSQTNVGSSFDGCHADRRTLFERGSNVA